MRIIITGATSMIGIALIEECVRQGDKVLAVIRKNTKRAKNIPASSQVQIEYADMDSLEEVRGDGKPYDVFFHLAWGYTDKKKRDMPMQQERNIKATLQAVESAHRLGCWKFIGAGSQAEYGDVEGIVDETTSCNPETSYGMAKLAASMLSHKMCEQFEMAYVWTRIFSVYGIHDHAETMIDYALNQFLKNKDVNFTMATNTWNYLYETDAGKMLYLLGVMNIESGIYNIAYQESRLLREYIEEMIAVTDTKGKPCFMENQREKALNLNPDIRKFVNATGYTPKVDFTTGIKLIVTNKQAIYKVGG